MQLLTKAIKKQLPKLYTTENTPIFEKRIICKFFNPIGAGTWFIFEGEEVEDDFLLFGICHLHTWECGYISLNELQELKLPLGLSIERDIHFESELVSKIDEIPDTFKKR